MQTIDRERCPELTADEDRAAYHLLSGHLWQHVARQRSQDPPRGPLTVGEWAMLLLAAALLGGAVAAWVGAR